MDDALRGYSRTKQRRVRVLSDTLAEERARVRTRKGTERRVRQREYYQKIGGRRASSCWPRIDFRREYVKLLQFTQK